MPVTESHVFPRRGSIRIQIPRSFAAKSMTRAKRAQCHTPMFYIGVVDSTVASDIMRF